MEEIQFRKTNRTTNYFVLQLELCQKKVVSLDKKIILFKKILIIVSVTILIIRAL